nr:reverse transcriptase domain-containing protein [Tanacetum cinerariifolium]
MLTMEEMLAKFIDKGKRKHEEIETFIKEFRTTNELLLKERSNLLSELKLKVNELSKVMSNVLIPKYEVNRVTTKGGKMTSEAAPSKEINETGINKNEPLRFKQDVQEKPHDVDVKNKSSSIHKRNTQSLVLSCLAQQTAIKRKDPRSFTIPCQVLEKHKKAEDLAAYHLSRFENPHMEVLTEREIADNFSDEHSMVLKSKFNNDEPWYADFINYIVGKVVPPNWTSKKERGFFSQVKTHFWEEPYAFKLCVNDIMRRCVAGSETLEILAHCHSGPTGRHHSASVTAKKVYESGFYWPSVFKDAILNELAKLRDGAYENTRIYKERTKKWHDSRLLGDKYFKVGDKVLLYNSRLKMYLGKLNSKWSGPNIVKTVYPYGAVEIIDKNRCNFKVNGQRLKKYYEGDIDKVDDEVIEFENGVT